MRYEHAWVSPAEAIKVSDGDTIDVILDLGFGTYRKDRLRFRRINAYETRLTKGVTPKQKKLGLLGKAFLQELIAERTLFVRTYPERTRGSLRRYIAEVYIRAEDVPATVVRWSPRMKKRPHPSPSPRITQKQYDERKRVQIPGLTNVNDIMVLNGYGIYKDY